MTSYLWDLCNISEMVVVFLQQSKRLGHRGRGGHRGITKIEDREKEFAPDWRRHWEALPVSAIYANKACNPRRGVYT